LVIIFDLEGVLIDNSKRYKYAIKKADPKARDIDELSPRARKIFWNNFFNPDLARKLDKVNLKALKIFNDYVNKGKKVIILSGTRKEIVETLIQKLKEEAKKHNYQFKPFLVIWRNKKDLRKAPEFKLSKIREIESLIGEEIEIVYDDNSETIEKLRKNNINAVLWE